MKIKIGVAMMLISLVLGGCDTYHRVFGGGGKGQTYPTAFDANWKADNNVATEIWFSGNSQLGLANGEITRPGPTGGKREFSGNVSGNTFSGYIDGDSAMTAVVSGSGDKLTVTAGTFVATYTKN